MLKLVPVDADDAKARADVVAFVNANYASPLGPMSEGAFRTTSFFWAHDDDGVRVGVTAFVQKTKWLAESVKTVVDPAHRGRGLGVALSQAIEDELKRRGFTKVMTTIYVDNLPMIFIKLKQGYLVEGIHRDHEKPGLHEYSLGKVLA
jgi:GNAT superfamily N-acetyltransferase